MLHLSKNLPCWDQSIDPFTSFPTNTLGCLILEDIPLYQSFLSLRSLTEFKLEDSQFNHPIDTLLEFLERNTLLGSVDLEIKFVDPGLCTSLHRVIKNKLQFLGVTSEDLEVIKALI